MPDRMIVVGSPAGLLREALPSVALLHDAYDQLPGFKRGSSRIACVRSALTVRDYLRSVGLAAEVAPVALLMVAAAPGGQVVLRSVGSGDGEPDIPGKWNGHLVVIADGYMIDPTVDQARRAPFEKLPSILAVPVTNQASPVIGLSPLASFRGSDGDQTLTLTWLSAPKNTAWADGEAMAEQHRTMVANALARRFKAGQKALQ